MTNIVIRIITSSDHEQLFKLIRSILSETGAQKSEVFSPELWRWQCLSPGFETLIVVAEDQGELVGCYHLVSRAMSNKGISGKMVLLQELGVHPEYRRHGLFMRMSEYAVNEVTRRGWDITYSFPNYRSFPGFIKKQRYTHVGNAPVWVRPLDPGKLLETRLPLKTLIRRASNLGMHLYDLMFLRGAPSQDDVRQITRFDGEVDQLSQDFLAHMDIGCIRNARFLNWRFLEKPTQEYSAWESRQQGRTGSYLVTRRAHMFGTECLLLMDFGCLRGCESDLLNLIAMRMQAERADGAVLAVTMGTHPFFRRLARIGFVPVPDLINPRPLRLIVRGHTQRAGDDIYMISRWFTSLADWDVL